MKKKMSKTHWNDLVFVFVDVVCVCVCGAICRHLKMTTSFEQHFLLIAHLLFGHKRWRGEERGISGAYVTKKTKEHKNCYIFTTFHVYSFYIHSPCDADADAHTQQNIGWEWRMRWLQYIWLKIYRVAFWCVYAIWESILCDYRDCVRVLVVDIISRIVPEQRPYHI